MSVVAAAVLIDRVLIAADCRLTWRHQGVEVHADNALKLYVLGPYSVLGVVGNDADAAARVVREALRQVARARSRDPRWGDHPSRVSLWLPRYLRWAYARVGAGRSLSFLLASAVPGVPTVLHRSLLGALMRAIAEAQSRSWMPGWLPEGLLAAQDNPHGLVSFSGTARGRIEVMKSPNFARDVVGTLGFAAIGSGGATTEKAIEERAEMVFAGGGFEEGTFDSSIASYCRRAGISTVGGLRPTYEIVAGGIRPLTTHVRKRFGQDDEEEIALEYRNGVWIQRNLTRGVEQRIRPLWRAIAEARSGRSGRFDDDFFDL